ncbi:MGDG synthase family glycosyltransferase [Undibacterium fentianense]|uniref:Glycosyltransferase n=1 Tax=Undibacterium fentianense TaxID=2828728 RepID=A0A941E212_9BURK|nr:glycosyltransferase [Undibacterium fentianense]MBR7799941.1 glycosyltransferase [Undibacterium fentianense]
MTDSINHTHQRILILSVSAGAGHARAAEAIKAQAAITYPESVVVHWDAMDFVTAGFRKIYTDFYIKLVNHAPALWGYLYHRSNDAKPDSTLEKLRRQLERWNATALVRAIQEFEADAIICTHFLPAEMLSRLLASQRVECPISVVVTDFDLHRMWVHQGISRYFAASHEVAFRMQQYGIPLECIKITGIPIMPSFGHRWDRFACCTELKLDPQRHVVMLMGGGAGLGNMTRLAERILHMRTMESDVSSFQLIVLTGKNVEALESLQALEREFPDRLRPIGFRSDVERLMACADLIITKPGGLTSSECLAMGLPMIVNAPIPGQEERNADYVIENGAGLKAVDGLALEFRLQQLLSNPVRLAAMQKRARELGRADAARCVIGDVMLQLRSHSI